jgi:hypothetical protein
MKTSQVAVLATLVLLCFSAAMFVQASEVEVSTEIQSVCFRTISCVFC